MTDDSRTGLVQLYTGDGKGKTSAALGLALRAAGQGLSVCVVQFAKAIDVRSGELIAAEKIPNIEIARFGDSHVWGGLMPRKKLPAQAADLTRAAFDYAAEAVYSERDVVVLDEVCVVITLGLLAEERVLDLVADKPERVEVVLTGRGATRALLDAADLVTEMVEVRYPASEGAGPRRGIEY